MATIVIEKTDLVGADQLATFLDRRMAQVTRHDGSAVSGQVDAFIAAAALRIIWRRVISCGYRKGPESRAGADYRS